MPKRIAVTAALLATATTATLSGTLSADAAVTKEPTWTVLAAFKRADHGKLAVVGGVAVRRRDRYPLLKGGCVCLQVKAPARGRWTTVACARQGASNPRLVRLTVTWPRRGSVLRLFHPETTTTLPSYDTPVNAPTR